MLKPKYIVYVALALGALFFSGCSGKQYFEPKQAYGVSASGSYGDTIVDLTRDGATLESGRYIGKAGISKTKLLKGYRFLSESDKYMLSSNTQGILNIYDKTTHKIVRAVALHFPVVSASIHRGIIAYILSNNTFGLYQISGNKKLTESRSERTYAIDTRAASPMFVDNLAVMPMLDGKLIIVDSKNTENTKVVYLSSYKMFNNVVYLSRMKNTMIVATPKKIVTIGDAGKKEYRANISETALGEKSIYLFTKEGEVIKLNTSLQPLIKKKFKFAHFSAATVYGGRVYGLDQHGSLIVLSPDLRKMRVYELGKVEEPVFISGPRLYKDGSVINLSSLGYE